MNKRQLKKREKYKTVRSIMSQIYKGRLRYWQYKQGFRAFLKIKFGKWHFYQKVGV